MLYRGAPAQLQHNVAGSTPAHNDHMEGAGAEYEELDVLGEQSASQNYSHPPNRDYDFTQCVAYGPVNAIIQQRS